MWVCGCGFVGVHLWVCVCVCERLCVRCDAWQSAGSGKAKDMSKKAVLLSGPPGIGKTSAAHIISRCVCGGGGRGDAWMWGGDGGRHPGG